MNKGTSTFLYVVLSLTLVMGLMLNDSPASGKLFIGILYLSSFLIMYLFKYGKDFFRGSFSEQERDSKVLLAGVRVDSENDQDKKDERYLDFNSARWRAKRKFVYILFILLLVAQAWRDPAALMGQTPHIISLLSIISAIYVGHFLIALGINALLVIFTYTPAIHFLVYGIYVFLVLLSLFLIRSSQAEARESFERRTLSSFVGIALLFTALTYGFFSVLTDALKQDKKSGPSLAQKKMIHQYLQTAEADAQKMSAGLGELKLISGKREELLRNLDLNAQEIKRLKDLLDKEGLFEGQKSEARNLLEGIMDKQEGLMQEYSSLSASSLANMSPTDLEKESFENLPSGNGGLTDVEKNNIQSYLRRMGSELEKQSGATAVQAKEKLAELQEMMEKAQVTPEDKERITAALRDVQKQTEDIQQEMKRAKDQGEGLTRQLDQKQKERLIKPLKKEEENEKDWIKKLLRYFPLIILFVIGYAIYRFFNKKGIKKVEVADEQVTEELRSQWKKLRRLKLSPREEVIHYYNLLHDSLQKIHYTGTETPPSCIVYEDMKEINPGLEKATLVITEIFAQCFYGDKNVSGDTLKLFRKALNKILKVYQLN